MPESSPHPFEFFAASVAGGVAFIFTKAGALDDPCRNTLLRNTSGEFTGSVPISGSQKDGRDDRAIVFIDEASLDDYPDRCLWDRGFLALSKFLRTDQQLADRARFAFHHSGQAKREPGSQRIIAWLAPPQRLASPTIQTIHMQGERHNGEKNRFPIPA